MTAPHLHASGDVEHLGCRFPTHLHYDVANHIWYEPLDSGDVRVGMTCVAVALADNSIFAFTPRRIGRAFEAGTSVATIESSKWVGPARIAFDGIVVEINDELTAHPAWLADDPYGRGWMMVVRPDDREALSSLVTGPDLAAAYVGWMNASDFPGCIPGAT